AARPPPCGERDSPLRGAASWPWRVRVAGQPPLPLGEAARSAGEGVRTSSSVRAHRHPSPQPSPRGRGRKPQLDNDPIKLDTVVSIKDGSIEEALAWRPPLNVTITRCSPSAVPR